MQLDSSDAKSPRGAASGTPVLSSLGSPQETGGAGPPVVVVHGAMDSSRSFRLVARYLTNWTVLGYDRRGWGQSRALGHDGISLETHVSDLCQVLHTLSAPIVAGHSYGALVALSAAGREPRLFGGIVAFEPPVRWLPWWPANDPWEQAVRDGASRGPQHAARAMLEMATDTARRGGRADPDARDLTDDGTSLVIEMQDRLLESPLFEPLTLRTPVAVAAGSASVAHHREVARQLAVLLPDASFTEISGARHPAHVTHPRQFADLIRTLAARSSVDSSATAELEAQVKAAHGN